MTVLPTTFIPASNENRMHHAGDVAKARNSFESNRPNNLDQLLRHRYLWMNEYLNGLNAVIELGCGAGFSKFYIENKNLILTDVSNQPWVDKWVDALDLPFADESVDAFLLSHMLHHVSHPKSFLMNLSKKLKKNGIIVIQDVYTGALMRFLLLLMKHEGWSYDVEIFDETAAVNNPDDPWSANCAIPDLLFSDTEKFEKNFPELKVSKLEKNECLLFPLSGGVISKTIMIPLPVFVLKIIAKIDSVLVKLAPSFFAMGISVVLTKRDSKK